MIVRAVKIKACSSKKSGSWQQHDLIRFPFLRADSERDMPGIKPGPLRWHTSALTTELHEVREQVGPKFWGASNYCPSVAFNQNTKPNVADLNPFIAVSG